MRISRLLKEGVDGVASAAGPDARSRDDGDAGAHRRGAATTQTAPRRQPARTVFSWRRATALVTALAFTAAAAPEIADARQAAPRGADRESTKIDLLHDPLVCVNTDLAPKVDAAVTPGKQYDKGYVFFKAAGTDDYYYAVMKGAPDKLDAVLPRPLPETKAIDYNVKAYDTDEESKKKGDYNPPVVPGNACPVKRGVAVDPKKGAGLTIGLTKEGQNPAPPGFRKEDIAFVILLSGAVVSLAVALKSAGAAAGTGAAGGGLSTAAVVAGGVVVAGAAAGIAVGTSSKKATPTPTPLRFVQAEVTWSGLGDIDLQILNASNQAVGSTFPAGCESTASRTERVLLEGAALANGTYHLALTGKSCGVGTPSLISAVVTVQSEAGAKCGSSFLSVPLGATANGCTFTIP